MTQTEELLHTALQNAWQSVSAQLDIADPILPTGVTITRPSILFGDYSTNAALVLAKIAKKKPVELATLLREHLHLALTEKFPIEKIEVVNPGFINFWLDPTYLAETITQYPQKVYLEKILAEGTQTRKILLEHTSPNTNKSLHIGHLRNNVLGMSIGNILTATGNRVTLDCIYNDRGIHICKAMWGYLKQNHLTTPWSEVFKLWLTNKKEWPTPESRSIKPDHFVETFYNLGVSQESVETNLQEMQEILLAWEAGEPGVRALWAELNAWVYQGFETTYKAINSHHDHAWYESEFFEAAKTTVQEGLAAGVFKQLPDGAILTDLESKKLTDTIVQRRDGTSMYFTQDIYLTKLKTQKFPSDQYLWIVGPEQQLHLQQVFAVCDQLGIVNREKLHHFWYGYVLLKNQGKMSSRKGTVISIDALVAESKERAHRLMSTVKQDSAFSAREQEIVAEKVGIAAIKYALLKAEKNQNIEFDWNETVNLKGNSGPYIQYVYARCVSVAAKATHETKTSDFDTKNLTSEENVLLRKLYQYPHIVQSAAKDFSPHYICTYLFDLAQTFNTFYDHCKVIGSPEEARRLTLINASAAVIKSGLGLLGIETLEKM